MSNIIEFKRRALQDTDDVCCESGCGKQGLIKLRLEDFETHAPIVKFFCDEHFPAHYRTTSP